MTREEAVKDFKIIREDYWDEYNDPMPALDMAIKALEQQSEDAISRQAAIDIVQYECGEWKGLAQEIVKQFNGLPSIQPKQIECEDAISRAETVQFLINHSNDFEDAKIRMAFQTASSLVNNPHNISSVYPKSKIGHWVEYTRVLIPEPINRWEQAWYCSECGYGNQECEDGSAWLEWKYCPNCGARMVESQEKVRDKE